MLLLVCAQAVQLNCEQFCTASHLDCFLLQSIWLLSTIVGATGLVPAVLIVFAAAALLLLRLSKYGRNSSRFGSITGNWSSDTNISASHVHRSSVDDLSGSFAEPQSSALASDMLDSCTICQLTSAPTTPVISHTKHTEFCTALSSLGTQHSRSLLPLLPLQAEGNFRLIPAPLWQEVAIPADRVCIVQTSAGQDWMLGQGSSGQVSYT